MSGLGRELKKWAFIPLAMLTIVIMAVLILLAWYLFPPGIFGPDVYYTTVKFADPQLESRIVGDDEHWDVVAPIKKLTPKGREVLWSEVKVIIYGINGSYYHEELGPEADDPSEYDDGADGTVDIEVWYVNGVGDPLHLEAGDGIKITGLTSEFIGASVNLQVKGRSIGNFIVPYYL
jgi:hypothetical protein